MNSVKTVITILIRVFMLLAVSVFAQDWAELKPAVLEAIQDGADYASDVLLDENGKSRCDYHLVQGKWYDYEPPWHTGQLVYALVDAYDITKNEKYLQAAVRAGNWWKSLEITDHPKLKGMLRAVHGDANPHIVFATVSDGSAGLFLLSKTTGNNEYADVATSAGDWMMKNMWVPKQKVFYDCVNPETGEVLKEKSPFWPDKEQQELFDVSRPNNEGSIFKDMFEHTGKKEYMDMFITLCESLLEYQDEYGLWMDFMPNDKESGYFHPRFNLWYAESLLEGYELTGDKRYLMAAKKTGDFYVNFQKDDGTFYYKNYVDGHSSTKSICGSAVSFAGIIWLRLLEYGVGDHYKDNIEKSVNWLVTNRYAKDHPDPNLAGGFFETRVRFIKGNVWIVNRDIATAFGVRFLSDFYRFLEK